MDFSPKNFILNNIPFLSLKLFVTKSKKIKKNNRTQKTEKKKTSYFKHEKLRNVIECGLIARCYFFDLCKVKARNGRSYSTQANHKILHNTRTNTEILLYSQ